MQLIFFGSPSEAVDSLESLVAAGNDIVAVYTQPDRRAGRGRTKTPTPVKEFAVAHGMPVFTPKSLKNNTEVRERLTAASADVFVVVAYGRILPLDILQIPAMGVVNVHPSLLPLYRGTSPVVTAILDGQARTGVTLMLLDEGMDTGPVLAQSPPIELSGHERGADLQAQLFKEGAGMLPGVLEGLRDGTIVPIPQDDSKATLTRLLERSDGEIDWSQSAERIDRMVRAFDPWPGTFTTWNGKNLKIVDVKLLVSGETAFNGQPGVVLVQEQRIFVGTGGGTAIEITRLQLEGRQAVSADDFVRGQSEIDGATLGS